MKLEKQFEKYLSAAKQYKLVLLAAFLVIVIIIGVVYVLLKTFLGLEAGPSYETGIAPLGGIGYITPFERQIDEQASKVLSKPTEFEIKKGHATIKSTDATADYEKFRQKAISYDGWVESVYKYEDYKTKTITTDIKMPFEKFDSFVEWLMKNYNVENANLQLYKVSVERQQDEIEILLTAMGVYDRLLERAEAMNVTKDNIEVIMMITQRKLDVMRLLREYGYSIEQIEKESKNADLQITITQEKKVKLMPEDLGTELRTKLRNSIREISNAGLDLVTVPIVILTKTILWIIYALIIVIPVIIAIRILIKIYKFVSKKMF